MCLRNYETIRTLLAVITNHPDRSLCPVASASVSVVPIPGKPFLRDGRRYLPAFQISLHPELAPGLPRRVATK
jgi:hypothetical protein